MYRKSQMPIREFSILTGISKDSLRFYDKIGLLSPELRGENNYRYYTERQIELAFLISDLRALGIGLEEIKQYADERSPERMLAFFSEQNTRIEAEIEHLHSIQELMRLRSDMATQALRYPEDIVVLEEREQEPIFLCPLEDNGGTDIDRINFAYNYAAAHGVNIGFPSGTIIPQQNLETGDWSPAQYYFKVSKKRNAWKSAGTYAVFYGWGVNNSTNECYKPLITFIQENGFHIASDAYEEYILDELSTHEWEQYKIRVEVRVTK